MHTWFDAQLDQKILDSIYMLPLVLIQLMSRLLGSIIIKDLTLELTRLCILIERVIKVQS